MYNKEIKHGVRAITSTLTRTASAILVLSLVACGGGGSDDGGGDPGDLGPGGGIFGTGVHIEGTVSTQFMLADSSVEFKRESGETAAGAIDSNGTFEADEVPGSGAVLLRTTINNGSNLFALALPEDATDVSQNIHSYSDLVARNWFASNGLDIEAVFQSPGAISPLPSVAALRALEQTVSQITTDVQEDYNLDDVNLFNDAYLADGSGIDDFLVSNPVIINNGVINIFILDPNTNTQSQAASGIDVSDSLLDADNEAPSAPGGVRALPAASNEILLVWEPALDNVAISSYDIFRDGVLVDSTSFPVFSDIPLASGTQFTYTVVAVDSSGNQSVESQAVTAMTLASTDTTAPEAPTNLVLQPAVGGITVSWSQANTFDVASYQVNRMEGTGPLMEFVSVTTTFLTDTNVIGGTEYCYQITALDASLNTSEPTEILCAIAGGEAVTGTPEPGPDPVVTDPSLLNAPLVDVSGVACTTELPFTSINQDTTLEADCYLSNTNLTVSAGNLTLEPGVIIKFGAGDALRVNNGGSLTAEGTAQSPIVLTAIDPTPGFWDGVEIFGSNSLRNSLQFVQIEYGGGGSGSDEANVELLSISSNLGRLSISNSTLQHSAGFGFDSSSNTLLDEFSNMRVTNNRDAIQIAPNNLVALSAPLDLSGNEVDEISLSNSALDVPVQIMNFGFPYLVDGLDIEANVEILAGTVIRVISGEGVDVRGFDGGSLMISGTPEFPVIVTGEDPTPGSWDGIDYVFSNSANNVISNAVIEYGGSADNGGNIETSNATTDSRISLNNVTLSNALNFGFSFDDDTIIDGFDGVVSTANGVAGRVGVEEVGALNGSVAFTGNTLDRVEVFNSTVNVAQTWQPLGVPYFFEQGITAIAGLTIMPGTQLVFASGRELEVRSSAFLNALGTPGLPIVFTGAEPVAGFWEGIDFRFSTSPLNQMDNVIVQYGGEGNPSDNGNIELSCSGGSFSLLELSNAQILDSSGWGVYLGGTNCVVSLGENITGSGNASGFINVP